MTIIGYSDRINHALAFAAKHHDQQVRKGTRAPYLTQPANVAIILTRYGQDEGTVIAGILHDVIDDALRDGFLRETLQQRIAEKFGADVLATIRSVAQRRTGDDGVELDAEQRREDYLTRIGSASDTARCVCAAEKLHHGASLLADLRRTVDPTSVWARFPAGRDVTVRWYRRVVDRLHGIGFAAPIMDELDAVVTELETWRSA